MSWTISKEQAKKKLTDIRDLIDLLLNANSDSERLKAFKSLEKRLILGHSRLSNLAAWSAVINPSKALKRGLEKIEREKRRYESQVDDYLRGASSLLSKRTGLNSVVCRTILEAKRDGRKMLKSWPVRQTKRVVIPNVPAFTEFLVVGPRGSMKLDDVHQEYVTKLESEGKKLPTGWA